MTIPTEDAPPTPELDQLRQLVQQGIDELDRGEGITLEEAFAELRDRVAKRRLSVPR